MLGTQMMTRFKSRGEIEGYCPRLDETLASELEARGINFKFEPYKISFLQPQKRRTYLPDFLLDNGVLVETKGRFTTADRQKHLLIKEQYPEMDLRFVFQNPNGRISKKSKTTYAMWCDKHGFKWAKKTIPKEWLE